MAEEQNKVNKFLERHPKLGEGIGKPVEIKTLDDVIKEQEEIQKQYNSQMANIESNLTSFLEIEDPLVVNGKLLAMVRRPSMKEIKKLFPKELLEIGASGKVPTYDESEEMNKALYEMMGSLITKPKHTAEEWENKTNPYFIRAFYDHIMKMSQALETQVEGF